MRNSLTEKESPGLILVKIEEYSGLELWMAGIEQNRGHWSELEVVFISGRSQSSLSQAATRDFGYRTAFVQASADPELCG